MQDKSGCRAAQMDRSQSPQRTARTIGICPYQADYRSRLETDGKAAPPCPALRALHCAPPAVESMRLDGKAISRIIFFVNIATKPGCDHGLSDEDIPCLPRGGGKDWIMDKRNRYQKGHGLRHASSRPVRQNQTNGPPRERSIPPRRSHENAPRRPPGAWSEAARLSPFRKPQRIPLTKSHRPA
jgi:hypothetical protein